MTWDVSTIFITMRVESKSDIRSSVYFLSWFLQCWVSWVMCIFCILILYQIKFFQISKKKKQKLRGSPENLVRRTSIETHYVWSLQIPHTLSLERSHMKEFVFLPGVFLHLNMIRIFVFTNSTCHLKHSLVCGKIKQKSLNFQTNKKSPSIFNSKEIWREQGPVTNYLIKVPCCIFLKK